MHFHPMSNTSRLFFYHSSSFDSADPQPPSSTSLLHAYSPPLLTKASLSKLISSSASASPTSRIDLDCFSLPLPLSRKHRYSSKIR
jgi:hypothetical protein